MLPVQSRCCHWCYFTLNKNKQKFDTTTSKSLLCNDTCILISHIVTNALDILVRMTKLHYYLLYATGFYFHFVSYCMLCCHCKYAHLSVSRKWQKRKQQLRTANLTTSMDFAVTALYITESCKITTTTLKTIKIATTSTTRKYLQTKQKLLLNGYLPRHTSVPVQYSYLVCYSRNNSPDTTATINNINNTFNQNNF